MSNFVSKLLRRADAATSELPAFVFDDDEISRELASQLDKHAFDADPPAEPREVLAVEQAHGFVTRAIEHLRSDEARLVDEINTRMEKLRQVRVTLTAMSGAHDVLSADLSNPPAELPMPQVT
jgi:hypothetical protein